MPMNGVCDLELRQLIEGAFLPARCEVRCGDGMSLTLHFPKDAKHGELTVTRSLGELPDMHALHQLIAEVRQHRESLNRAGTLHGHG